MTMYSIAYVYAVRVESMWFCVVCLNFRPGSYKEDLQLNGLKGAS